MCERMHARGGLREQSRAAEKSGRKRMSASSDTALFLSERER